MSRVDELINELHLLPHPEGGYFREIYRSGEIIQPNTIPGFQDERNVCTSIYYLLNKTDISHFHRIKSDEIWHFYEGSPVVIHIIDDNGDHKKVVLGKAENASTFQTVIPKNLWFAAEVKNKEAYSLVGCTVAPGFDFMDFELAEREELIKKFPHLSEIINRLT